MSDAASYISALAALAGSMVGALASIATSWVVQRGQARAQQLAQDKSVREALYVEFIDEASRLYADALQHQGEEAAVLVGLYAKVSKMRLLSSPRIIESAEKTVESVLDTYLAPNRTFRELREIISSSTMDPLRAFSEACREELNAQESIIRICR
jgi:hypothetical protein